MDTNILAYAEGINEPEKRRAALELIEKLPEDAVVLPVQVLGELFRLLLRKAGRTPTNARQRILSWHDAFSVVEVSASAMLSAADLAVDHRFGIRDAILCSAAAEAGCRLLLSEDLQEGFTWRGITVANPFSARAHPLLASLVGGSAEASE